MLSQSQIGSRLRAAREQSALSPEEAADALGLLPEDVAGLESGRRAISTLEITKLAGIYHYPATFFLSKDGELDEDGLQAVLRREFFKRKFAPGVRAELWRLFDLYGEAAVLRGTLDRPIQPVLPDYSTQRADHSGDPGQEGEFAARQERRRLRLGSRPIPDVAGLIGGQGIWAAAAELPDDLSGLLVSHSDVGLVILANQQDSPARRRFSYLHQLAQALFDRSDRITVLARLRWGRRKPTPGEARANAFASAFLMPEKGVARQLEKAGREYPISHMRTDLEVSSNVRDRTRSPKITCQDIVILARHFGVSYKMAAVRLMNLDYIDSAEKKALDRNKRLAFPGPSKNPDPSETSGNEPRKELQLLALEAFRKKQISRGRFLEIGRKIGIDRQEFLELLDAVNLIDETR